MIKGLHRVVSTLRCAFLIALIGVSLDPSSAEQVNNLPKPTDYVSDYAHVLSPGMIEQLDHICSELDHSQADTQFAIVTVHALDGYDAAEYASQLEDKWKMGKKGSDRGVLLLLAVDDRKYRIDVGYGLEGILNDAKLGDIGRSMVPDLRAKAYDNAINLAVGQIANVIAFNSNVALTDATAREEPPEHHYSPGIRILQVSVFVVAIILYLLRIFGSFGLISGIWAFGSAGGSGSGGGGGGFGGFGGGSFGGGGAGGSW